MACEGGKIVSSTSLSALEISAAQVCNRMYIDKGGLGYVWLPVKQVETEGWNEVCQCGHLHNKHDLADKTIFNAGHCMVEECQCENFAPTENIESVEKLKSPLRQKNNFIIQRPIKAVEKENKSIGDLKEKAQELISLAYLRGQQECKDAWSKKLYDELKHLYDSYSDEWSEAQLERTSNLLTEYQIKNIP